MKKLPLPTYLQKDLSDEQYLAIGRFSVEFNGLESMLERAFDVLLGGSVEQSLSVKFIRDTFDQKLKLLDRLFTGYHALVHGSSSNNDEWVKIRKACEEINALRSQIVHSRRISVSAGEDTLTFTLQNPRDGKETPEPAAISDAIKRISDTKLPLIFAVMFLRNEIDRYNKKTRPSKVDKIWKRSK